MLNFRRINIISFLLLCVVGAFYVYGVISIWWLIIVACLWLLFTTIGSFHIRWNYHLQALHRVHLKDSRKVAITFDDGPHPEFTPQVLQLLKEYNAKGTFFCIGKEVDKYPEILSHISQEGHIVGNHTYTHSNKLGFFSTEKLVDELIKTSISIKSVTGFSPKLFRPAFGVTNPNISKAVKELELQTIGWSVRSLDTTSRDEGKVFKRIKKKMKNGDVILLHDTSDKTVKVLEQLLIVLQNKGIKSVTVADLFKIKAYE